MPSKITSLTRHRKQKARAEKRSQGDANSVKFGRTKAQRLAEESERGRVTKTLDQHKREE